MPVTSLEALLGPFSISLLSMIREGFHTGEAYSSKGLTNALYKGRNDCGVGVVKVTRIN